MGAITPQGISRKGLDADFAQKEAEKSNLLLQTKWARDSGDEDGDAQRFADAARLEEELAALCDAQNLPDKAHVHYYSAASAWAQAGDFHHALTLCETFLARPNLPSRLRQTVMNYAAIIRARRAQWYADLAATAA